MRVLFESVVGSHMWNMNHDGSDIDIFRVYLADTNDILLGRSQESQNYTEYGRIDVSSHELKKVLDQVFQNNFNFLVGVYSPLTRFGGIHQNRLIRLANLSLTKQAYNSIHGLALQNYKKYVETKKDDSEKRCNTICRTLQFGITLLEKGYPAFEKYDGGNAETILRLIKELDIAKDNSKLPEFQVYAPDGETLISKYDRLLLDYRKGLYMDE